MSAVLCRGRYWEIVVTKNNVDRSQAIQLLARQINKTHQAQGDTSFVFTDQLLLVAGDSANHKDMRDAVQDGPFPNSIFCATADVNTSRIPTEISGCPERSSLLVPSDCSRVMPGLVHNAMAVLLAQASGLGLADTTKLAGWFTRLPPHEKSVMLLLAKLADAAPIEAGKAHPIPSQLHVPPFDCFELFHKLDANSDSLIGLDQFTRVLGTTLKVSSEDVSDAELRELFDVVDVDGSGALPAFLVFLVLVLCVFCVVPILICCPPGICLPDLPYTCYQP